MRIYTTNAMWPHAFQSQTTLSDRLEPVYTCLWRLDVSDLKQVLQFVGKLVQVGAVICNGLAVLFILLCEF